MSRWIVLNGQTPHCLAILAQASSWFYFVRPLPEGSCVIPVVVADYTVARASSLRSVGSSACRGNGTTGRLLTADSGMQMMDPAPVQRALVQGRCLVTRLLDNDKWVLYNEGGDRPEEAASPHPRGTPPGAPPFTRPCEPRQPRVATRAWKPHCTREQLHSPCQVLILVWVGRPKGLVTPSCITLCLERQCCDAWVAGKPGETL